VRDNKRVPELAINALLFVCYYLLFYNHLIRIAHQQHALTIREHLLAAETEQLEYK